MKCARCRQPHAICWHIKTEKWELLPKRWWEEVLCLNCFVILVSAAHNRLIVLLPEDFGQILIGTKRVRGCIKGTWPFELTPSRRRSRNNLPGSAGRTTE